MKQNKGFSLVEIIIVITIMTVLAGLMSVSVSLIFGLDAKKCAKQLEGYLNLAKTNALSKDAEELRIYRGSDQQYYVDFVEYYYTGEVTNPTLTSKVIQTELIGKDTVTITYTLTSGSTGQIDVGKSITIGFHRSTGAFQAVKINDTQTAAYCTALTIARGTKQYTIEMIPETGKHIIS
ncbi:MAG: prepilin-type N-terminal cleavage/methylation domain-containing protein [Lachnospiraceae bacterium]